ncbi:CGNR zinc finger domain-containing protein [Streptomyces sp. H27-D2]|uniref:CGNR zinc finger domain-containing protein n=1 Tax=Streptomyces sp. H27-D2 TaxID=3046304 RepID=UPI002DB55B22|nr:CGNR zinc finger domain-containing protein [Streptomyces sp. H27-D2]MEC4018679.1 CGNR zinc finger domain-containing protein [Streptomyces sp. H27-D2]
MELAYYSDYAVRLVNTEQPARGEDTLTSVDAVRGLFGTSQQAARRATDADVTRLRGVRSRLRTIFEAADRGDEALAVDLLNALLMEFPVSPQISGHTDLAAKGDKADKGGRGPDAGPRGRAGDAGARPDWHMHIADHPANATAGYAATACMGLAFHLTELGVDRLGICQAAPCRNAYLDTSTNRSRRYCSDRCATRANVAAYRARKRLETERSTRTSRTDETAQESSAGTER